MSDQIIVNIAGRNIATYSISLENAYDQYAWKGTLLIANEQDWMNIKIKDAVSISIYDDVYSLIVDGKNKSRQGIDQPTLEVTVISSVDLYGNLSKVRYTGRYPQTNNASLLRMPSTVAASGLLGHLGINDLSISWETTNFNLPYFSFEADNLTAIQVLSSLASEAGAFVTATKSGGVSIKAKYKYALDQWYWGNAIIHNISSEDQLLGYDISYSSIDNISLRGLRFTPADDYSTDELSAQLDSRVHGFNAGRSQFNPGESAYIIVKSSSDVQWRTSVGSLSRAGSLVQEESYDIRDTEIGWDISRNCKVDATVIYGSTIATRNVVYDVYELKIPEGDIDEGYTIDVEFISTGNGFPQVCVEVNDDGLIEEVKSNFCFSDATLRTTRLNNILLDFEEMADITIDMIYNKDIVIGDLIQFKDDIYKYVGTVTGVKVTVDNLMAHLSLTTRCKLVV